MHLVAQQELLLLQHGVALQCVSSMEAGQGLTNCAIRLVLQPGAAEALMSNSSLVSAALAVAAVGMHPA